MKNTIINIIKNKKAVTLMEIMIAVCILAFTFIPVIGTLTKSAKDTETFNSYVFAQTTARNILDTILDDVPFHSIKVGAGNVAYLDDSYVYDVNSHKKIEYKVDKIMKMFDSKSKESKGLAKGVVEDDKRGIKYNVTLYVFPIAASNDETNSGSEIKFTFLPRPKFGDGSEDKWYTYSNNKIDNQYRQNGTDNPYKDYNVKKEKFNAYKLGVTKHKDDNYCVMKKLVLTVEWESKDKNEHKGKRKIALFTMKANLDSEKF